MSHAQLFHQHTVEQKLNIASHRMHSNRIAIAAQQNIIENLRLYAKRFDRVWVDGIIPSSFNDEAASTFSGSVVYTSPFTCNIGGPYDLIVSSLYMHAVNDVEQKIQEYISKLAPEGVMLLTLFGGKTLEELRLPITALEKKHHQGHSPRFMPKMQLQDLARLMQKHGLQKTVATAEEFVVHYHSLKKLRNDLQALALGNSLAGRSHQYIGKKFYHDLQGVLAPSQNFSVTYELLTALAVKL